MDIATLAQLLRETEEHHGQYEKTHAAHHWSDWYAAYLNARLDSKNSDQAATVADHYMAQVLKVTRL